MEYFDRVCGAQNTASLEIFTQLMAGFGIATEDAPDYFRWGQLIVQLFLICRSRPQFGWHVISYFTLSHIQRFLKQLLSYTINFPRFRAFDIKKDNEINSQEFILGLAAMDPNTPHGSSSAEMR